MSIDRREKNQNRRPLRLRWGRCCGSRPPREKHVATRSRKERVARVGASKKARRRDASWVADLRAELAPPANPGQTHLGAQKHAPKRPTSDQTGIPAELKHISKRRNEKLTRIPSVTASEAGRAQRRIPPHLAADGKCDVEEAELAARCGPPVHLIAAQAHPARVTGPSRLSGRVWSASFPGVGLLGNAAQRGW